MKKIIPIVVVLTIASLQLSGAGKWKRVKNLHGISVYTTPVKGSDISEFKGVGIVKAPLEVVNNVIDDVPGLKKWMGNCIKSDLIVRKSESYLILYNEIKAPWPVSNRDMVIESYITKTPEKIIRTIKAIKYSKIPPKKGKVRILDMQGRWTLIKKGDNKTLVTYQIRTDPAGKIPTFIANASSKALPYDTIKNLRKMVKKTKYQIK